MKFQDSSQSSEKLPTSIKRRENEEVVKTVSGFSAEKILAGISDLEGKNRKLLGDLAQALIEELEKLNQLQKAIKIETDRLEEIHGIKAEADSLANLFQLHTDKEKELKESFLTKEEEFKKSIEIKKEQWSREQEQYDYELQLKRKQEEDEYMEKKKMKEKELSERELQMKAREDELKELRKLRENFDHMLDEEIEKVANKAAKEARETEEVKAQILSEKMAADKKVMEMTVQMLQKQLRDQEGEVGRLKKELEIANKGVKDRAIKVIEGNRGRVEERRSLKDHEGLK